MYTQPEYQSTGKYPPPPDYETADEAIDFWLDTVAGWKNKETGREYSDDEWLARVMSGTSARFELLDGTLCRCTSAVSIKNGENKTSDSILVGPAKWRTVGIARSAVLKGDGSEKYPALDEYEFDDPLAPWWDNGTVGHGGMEIKANSTEGVLSLFHTLLGRSELDLDYGKTDRTVSEEIADLEAKRKHLENKIEMNESIAQSREREAQARALDPYSVYLAQGLLVEAQGLRQENAALRQQVQVIDERIRILKAKQQYLLENDPGYDETMPDHEKKTLEEGWNNAKDTYDDNPPSPRSNVWLFGFKLERGRNIAAAYHSMSHGGGVKNTFLYNDSRLIDVKSYSNSQFGVFYFAGTGYYWWDMPLLERSHEWTEKSGFNALGNEVFRVYKSHFDLYQGLPNPLKQRQVNSENFDYLDHERPLDMTDMTELGNWLQQYPPYGAYVFHVTTRLSDSLDVRMRDIVEPPAKNIDVPLSYNQPLYRPPYNDGYLDPVHLGGAFPQFLYFNDRHAPVRYDRALGWEKPFDDGCNHEDFNFSTSTDYLRSPFSDGGNRVVAGANGVLHVFDAVQGRMDFNAETLEKIL